MNSVTAWIRRLAAPVAILLVTGVLAACEPGPPGCGDAGDDPLYSATLPSGSLPAVAPSTCDPPPPCPGCGGGSGDPHLVTFDGKRYDLQSAAEVTAARTEDRSFEVQWRQEPYASTNTATVTAVAMRIAGTRVTIDTNGTLRVDGDEVEISEGEAIVLPTGVVVHHRPQQVIVVHDATAAAVHIQLDERALGILIDPPDAHEGLMAGLLGNDDGDAANDLVFADGEVIADPTWDQMYPGLAEAWRVTDAGSLFDYATGEGPDTYWDPSFPERRPSIDGFSAAERAAAEQVCRAAGVSDPGLLESCLFDVLITGDQSFAELFARQQLAAGIDLAAVGKDAGAPVGTVAESAALFDGTTDATWLTHGGDWVIGQMRNEQADAGVLVGMNLTNGSTWQLDGVDHRSPAAFVDDIVVAVAEPGGPFDGDETGGAALIAINPSTGQVIPDRRYDPVGHDATPIESSWLLAIDDGVLVADRTSVRRFAAGDLSLQWEATLPAGIEIRPYPATSGLVWVGWIADGGLEMGLIDTTDGTVVDTVQLGEQPGSVDPGATTDDGGLLIAVDGHPPALTRLDAVGEGDATRIERRWIAEIDRDSYGAEQVAVAGDNAVAYTASDVISGFSLADGSPRFETSVGIQNFGEIVAGNAAGLAFVTGSGDSFLQGIAADGTLAWALDDDDVVEGATGSAAAIITIGNELVVAAGDTSAGVVIVAVPLN